MNLQLGKIFLLLLFILLHMECTMENPSFSVIQTPVSLNVTEGETWSMVCRIKEYISFKWSLKWQTNKTDGKVDLHNTSKICILTDLKAAFSNLTLKRVDIDDSGLYVCRVESNDHPDVASNGTQLTVHGITDLMVTQTPESINAVEGEDVRIQCKFRSVSNLSTVSVRWHKVGLETNKTDLYGKSATVEQNSASLVLKDAKETDSGSYMCVVEISSRNLTGSGNLSHVVITKKQPPGTNGKTAGVEVGVLAGAGAGFVVVLLLVIGLLVWKHKQRSKGNSLSTTEPESVPTEEVRMPHSPLTSQMSDVTYAKLRFQKRQEQPDTEVIYAEVKTGRKQEGGTRRQT